MILRVIFFLLFTELTGHTMVRKFKIPLGKCHEYHFSSKNKHEKLGNEMDAGRATQIVRFMFGKWSEEKKFICILQCEMFLYFGCHRIIYTDNIKQLWKEPSFRYDMQIFFQLYRSNCIWGQITACPFV